MRYKSPQIGETFNNETPQEQFDDYKKGVAEIKNSFKNHLFLLKILKFKNKVEYYNDENKNIVLTLSANDIDSTDSFNSIGRMQEILTQRIKDYRVKAGDTRSPGHKDFYCIELHTGIKNVNWFEQKFKSHPLDSLGIENITKIKEAFNTLENSSFKITDFSPSEHKKLFKEDIKNQEKISKNKNLI